MPSHYPKVMRMARFRRLEIMVSLLDGERSDLYNSVILRWSPDISQGYTSAGS